MSVGNSLELIVPVDWWNS